MTSAGQPPVDEGTASRAAARRRIDDTIADGLRGGNSLNFLRLVLAAAVIFSHGFPLSGWGTDPFYYRFLGQENLGGLAVIGFFAISGYLITRSGMNKDVIQYLWARCLRIFPAFWTILVVSAFAIIPLVFLIDGRELGSYFDRGEPGGAWGYVLGNARLQIQQWGILDAFATTTPYGEVTGASVLNGSLWTLYYEFVCYLLIGGIVLFGAMRHAKIVIPALTALMLLLQVFRITDPAMIGQIVPWLADPLLVNLGLAFLWGACVATFADRIRFDDRLGLLSIAIVVFTLLRGGFALLGLPAVAYAVLWIGYRLRGPFLKLGATNDYSYGLYLYGFLVQQVLAHFGVFEWGYLPHTLLSLLIAMLFAVASWHLVEKQALKLKDIGPGRGMAWWFRWARARYSKKHAPLQEGSSS